MRLVVTRPLEDAGRQADRIEALGHEPLIHPLLEIHFPKFTPLQLTGVQGLIATSRNALRGLARNESFEAAKRLPVICVGEKTAEFARQSGFTHVLAGPGVAKELVPMITQTMRPSAGALLYLTGHHLAYNLEKPLWAAGFSVPRLIVYEAREIDEVSARKLATEIRHGVDGIILMSPRTAAIFAKLVRTFKLEREARAITCYCYSDAIAKPLSEIGGLTISVSSHPTEDDMMNLIGPAPYRSSALADLREVLGKR